MTFCYPLIRRDTPIRDFYYPALLRLDASWIIMRIFCHSHTAQFEKNNVIWVLLCSQAHTETQQSPQWAVVMSAHKKSYYSTWKPSVSTGCSIKLLAGWWKRKQTTWIYRRSSARSFQALGAAADLNEKTNSDPHSNSLVITPHVIELICYFGPWPSWWLNIFGLTKSALNRHRGAFYNHDIFTSIKGP